ncbi:MAG: SIS domain-containing protein [Candidatus Zixiibacteriota bacterium]
MTNRKQIIADAVGDAITLKTLFSHQREEWLLAASDKLAAALNGGNKILIAGNGGSAADSQHFAAEFIVRLTADNNRRALPAIALTTDTSILTAASNDYGFDFIFSRQVEALGNSGDTFIGLSTSGRSKNIIEAFRAAKSRGLTTLGLFGRSGLSEPALCDLALSVPSPTTMRIQEEHIFALHLLAQLTELLIQSELLHNSL